MPGFILNDGGKPIARVQESDPPMIPPVEGWERRKGVRVASVVLGGRTLCGVRYLRYSEARKHCRAGAACGVAQMAGQGIYTISHTLRIKHVAGPHMPPSGYDPLDGFVLIRPVIGAPENTFHRAYWDARGVIIKVDGIEERTIPATAEEAPHIMAGWVKEKLKDGFVQQFPSKSTSGAVGADCAAVPRAALVSVERAPLGAWFF